MKYGEVRHYLFDVEMLRRRLLRHLFYRYGINSRTGTAKNII